MLRVEMEGCHNWSPDFFERDKWLSTCFNVNLEQSTDRCLFNVYISQIITGKKIAG